MKLVASLIVHNELGRYLVPCVQSLASFCDEIRVWDDGSTDGTREALARHPAVKVTGTDERRFFDHEGLARQAALEWTMEANPTHVLAIDADELILEGEKLRAQLEHSEVWSLCMREVWKARRETLEIRQDGGWCEHPVPILWRVPRMLSNRWRIPNRALASGRTPAPVSHLRPRFTDVAIYHFGWACKDDRRDRYERYVRHDNGRFHRNSHIQSIMWPDMDIVATTETVKVPRPWVDRSQRQVVS